MNFNYSHKASFATLIFIFSLTVFHVGQLNGQFIKYDFEVYNTREGISHNHITAIVQDQKGFLWFGTEDGLNRFDGHDFKVYKHIDNDPHSIVSNFINTLFVDTDGSIWIGTSNGICKFNPNTEEVQHFPVDFIDVTKLNGAHVSAIQKHADGSIWISYKGSGVDIIIPDEPEIFHYTIHRDDEYKLPTDMVTTFQFMPDNFKLLGTYTGLTVIDSIGFVLNEKEASLKYPWVASIKHSIRNMLLEEDKNILWIGTELNGLFRINLLDHSVKEFNNTNSGLTSNEVLTLYRDSNKNIWFGGDATYLYNPAKEDFDWYSEHGMYYKTHLKSIFEDKDHNIWMGTTRIGILKFNPRDTKIFHYHSNQGENSIKSDEILSFNQDNTGNIWVGTGGTGLFKMKENKKGFDESPINAQLSSQTIKCIYKDVDGTFWMGTWDGGMMKYQPETNKLEVYHPDRGNFRSRHVWDITGDQDGTLWIGSLRDGLCEFSPETKKYIHYNYIPGDTTALVNDDVQSVLVDSRNILWVGTANGLSIRFPGSNVFTNRLKFKTNQNNALSNSVISTMNEDHNGRIWLGTNGGGIAVLSVKDKEVKVEKILKETDGLPSNTITSILNDDNGNVWISSYNGLAKLNASDYSIMETSQISTLEGTEYLGQSRFKSSDGRIFFGGVTGFHMFHPDSLETNQVQAEIYFTSLKIFTDEINPHNNYRGRKILKESIINTKEINLSHEDYSFTISFAPLVFNGQKSLRYAYFLENLDKDWQYTSSNRRFVHYSNLAPGEYTLKVKASFDGKEWPEEATTLKISISPPWWSSLYTKLFVLFFLCGIIYTIFKQRLRFLKKQSEKLEDLVELRTAELSKSNSEIHKLLEKVAHQKDNIEHKNHELQEMNEELGAQRDSLELKSSELEKAQENLQEVNLRLEILVQKRTQTLNDILQELETFLYRASHDLQGPISTMQGLISLAKLEENFELTETKYWNHFHFAVTKLETTLKKLLQKHAIQKINIHYEAFNKMSLSLFINDIVREIRFFRSENFVLQIPEGFEFKSDRALLTIMLSNLLENAFFFSEKSENKSVILSFSERGQETIISVKDFGTGIKQEQKSLIFMMFYRGSELSTGNGLGLYLVKSAAEKLNGTVVLESEEGKCSNFQLCLPVEKEKLEVLAQ